MRSDRNSGLKSYKIIKAQIDAKLVPKIELSTFGVVAGEELKTEIKISRLGERFASWRVVSCEPVL
jgi:hypothetical protein